LPDSQKNEVQYGLPLAGIIIAAVLKKEYLLLSVTGNIFIFV
jgi:hypothetical protein